MLSRSVNLSGVLIPYSVYILVLNSHMGKAKGYSVCSCPDAFSSVVCRKFFSIAVDFDAPSNF